jgi:hypothetical protein
MKDIPGEIAPLDVFFFPKRLLLYSCGAQACRLLPSLVFLGSGFTHGWVGSGRLNNRQFGNGRMEIAVANNGGGWTSFISADWVFCMQETDTIVTEEAMSAPPHAHTLPWLEVRDAY